MKKVFIALLIIVSSGLLMTFFVANVAEKEIKMILSDNTQANIEVNLVSYQKHFFKASAITSVKITDDDISLSLKIISDIHHYPHQAVIKNSIEIEDATMADRAFAYFGTQQWITSTEKINLFSQLTGQLNVVAGQYKSESESFSSEPAFLDYQFDLKSKTGKVNLDWAGLKGAVFATSVNLQSLQLSYQLGSLFTQQDYEYQLKIAQFELQEGRNYSLLNGVHLKGSSQQGQGDGTIDTSNELVVDEYQVEQRIFKDNHLTLAITGLYQPAFELLSRGSGNSQEVETALIELFNHGAQIKLSKLNSQTPWGEFDGMLDLTLAEGASLMDVVVNPYMLFDHVTGDVSLMLPASLLAEPDFAYILQTGVVTGFLQEDSESLNMKSSLHQGEFIVNGKVIPL